MKIVILLGSPNRKGSTHLLAEAFCKGRGGSRPQRPDGGCRSRRCPPLHGLRPLRL